jgi:hypothetical protein
VRKKLSLNLHIVSILKTEVANAVICQKTTLRCAPGNQSFFHLHYSTPERNGLVFRVHCLFVRSALFWDITRRRVVMVYRPFGATYRSHLHGSRVREDGTDTLFRNVVKPLLHDAAQYPRIPEYLINIAAEA